MADTYTVFVRRNNAWVEATGTSPTTPSTSSGDVYWNDILGKPATFPSEERFLEISNVNGLDTRLDTIEADLATSLPTGTFQVVMFETTNPNAARPTVSTNVSVWWDLGAGATTPPVNMATQDRWLS